MHHCVVPQNAFPACEEMRNTVSISDRRDTVVCPKPRRLGLLGNGFNDPIRPLRWHLSHQPESTDSKAGMELLDIILTKGGYGSDQPMSQVASSPPFFCGSPPSRAANPLVHDARFGEEKLPVPSLPIPSGLSMSPSTPSSARKGCVRSKFGPTAATVRVEGFDCLDRDRQNRRISAVA
ncbi:hypothetical protein AAC387_Pa10g1459 [Persea americana]